MKLIFMKVKNLKELLALGCEGLTDEEFDNLDVLIPLSDIFDGYWRHPCPQETGVSDLGIDENDLAAPDLAFCIVPHAFFEEKEGFSPELN